MVSSPVELNNPYTWIFLTGLFFGTGFGRMPFLYLKRSRERPLGSRGWIFISITVSMAVLAAVTAVFVTSGGLFSGEPVDLFFLETREWIPLVSSAFAAGVLIRRFPRSAGIPLLILFSALIFFSFRVFDSWSSSGPNQEILRVKIVAEDDVSVVKFTFPPEGELLSTIEGKGILPAAERIKCSPAFFFLGNGELYRINGLLLSEPPGRTVPFHSPDSGNFMWGDWFVWAAERISFLEYSIEKPDGSPPGLNETISFFFDEDGKLRSNSVSPFLND